MFAILYRHYCEVNTSCTDPLRLPGASMCHATTCDFTHADLKEEYSFDLHWIAFSEPALGPHRCGFSRGSSPGLPIRSSSGFSRGTLAQDRQILLLGSTRHLRYDAGTSSSNDFSSREPFDEALTDRQAKFSSGRNPIAFHGDGSGGHQQCAVSGVKTVEIARRMTVPRRSGGTREATLTMRSPARSGAPLGLLAKLTSIINCTSNRRPRSCNYAIKRQGVRLSKTN